jgi:hypothetical protein
MLKTGEPGEALIDIQNARAYATINQLLPQQWRAQTAGIGKPLRRIRQRLNGGFIPEILLIFVPFIHRV